MILGINNVQETESGAGHLSTNGPLGYVRPQPLRNDFATPQASVKLSALDLVRWCAVEAKAQQTAHL